MEIFLFLELFNLGSTGKGSESTSTRLSVF